uniref:Copper amine oxidase N2-terminal domain-containing protein n=1 Tax=Aegilops tauschii subsp. strangulata TaxID=200361 RepID=A0A453MA31_AEGTS
PLFASALVVHALALDEPDKPAVWRWWKGAHTLPPRRTIGVVRFRGESYMLVVDLAAGKVAPLPAPVSGYPMMTMDEQAALCAAPFNDPTFKPPSGAAACMEKHRKHDIFE